jgi:tRNA-splicing endonuclease subunit Sen54
MADVDEDAIPASSGSGGGRPDDDLEDEAQDFRFLAQLTGTQGAAVIPKRGTKDFEPNPTRSQASALEASRLAMHTALSAGRYHGGKNHLVGQYIADENDWRWDDSEKRSGGRCVVVNKFKSTHLKVMGMADRKNRVWFLPEEALFLLERGSLDIRWPDDKKEVGGDEDTSAEEDGKKSVPNAVADVDSPPDGDDGDDQVGALPMSLQGAYASFINKDGLTLERYSVYAGLKRAGYVVQRAPMWYDGADYTGTRQPRRDSTTTTSSHNQQSSATAVIYRLVSWLFREEKKACPASGPLVAPGLYRNYTDMFRMLALINYHDGTNPTKVEAAPAGRPSPAGPFRVHYHVWKPSTSNTYRKTAPPPPDYRIAVVDARTTAVPTLTQIGDLLDSQPENLNSSKRLETRVKHGRRHVLLAVVDTGVVSYLRLSDACFGAEKLFEEKVAGAGGKGRGRGGGVAGRGGRGGGRGGKR